MRKLIGFVALAVTPAIAAAEIDVYRDPGCGCCMNWAAQVKVAFGEKMRIVDDAARPTLQRKVGVPPQFASCHTAIISGYALEGHVPIADMKRLIATKPKGVMGLAVAGMPLGSPGMEMPGRPAERYNVIAFGSGKPVIFARH